MERCPVCGSPVRAGANFCTACGHRLTSGESTAPTAVAAPPVPLVDSQKPTADISAESDLPSLAPVAPAAGNDVETSETVTTTQAPWAMPAPAEPFTQGSERWSESGPRASADLWPSPERAADPWGTAGSAAGLGGEPSREGYAAWDAAPSSWIGWNTPSHEEVDDTILLETPEAPAEDASPTDDQDETAPFAWPGEAGSGTEAESEQAGIDGAARTGGEQDEDPEPTPGSDEEMLFVTEAEEPATAPAGRARRVGGSGGAQPI